MDSRIVPRGFLSLSRLPRPVGWRRSLAKCVRARRGFATMDGVGNENAPTPRKNGIGIQMISHYLHSTLFPSHKPTQKPWQLALAQQHLSTHNLLNKALDVTPDPNIDLPPLVGADMKEHIRVLGEEQAAGYLRLAEGFMREGLPPLPETWRQGPKAEGWVRYDTRKKSYVTKSVPYPDDDALVFDTEVLYKIGGFPVIAVAASSRYWYAWTTPGLFSGKDPENFVPRTLIPLGPHDRKRIVVGHHVAYDRARILEEYRLEGTEFGFVDTLSMHSAVGGLSTQQRPAWIMRKQQDRIAKLQQGDLDGASGEVGGGDGGKAEGTAEGKRRKKDVGEAGEAPQSVDGGKEAEAKKEPRPSTTRPGVLKPTGPDMPTLEEFQEPGTTTTSWEDVSSLNNMGHIAELYLGEQVDKSVRKDFETTDPRTVIDNFQELMSYCAKDVDVTHRLFKAIMPRFRAKCPHPASFAGMLHMGKGYLPISDDWNKYVRDSEAKFQEFHQDIHVRLTRLVDEAVEKGKDGSWKSDPWLSQLDWTIQEAKFTKAGKPARQQGLPGKPKWYSDLWDKKTGSLNISLRTRITPYLLALQWKKYPLYYISAFGWTYVVPKGEVVDGGQDTQRLRFSDKPGERTYDPRASHDTTHDYFRVPHPGGDGANCGSPLSKSFMTAFENGTLTSTYEGARHILSLSSQCTYWLSAKQRVNSQFVIWERDLKGLPGGVPKMPEGKGYGVILPQSITMGTVTRRAVEGTWMTAANAKKNRIGTELKCQVQAPPGYKMVGADVDSEELWIASLLGDAQFNMHGATAIGFMTLQGSKVNKTDLHTVTGNILGTSRDNAKVFNYSRIYGAGIKYAVQLLLQASPGLAKDVALQKAEQLYRSTKGLRSKGRQIWEVDDAKTSVQYYHGGTESFMFNQLERIGTSRRPKTPVLGCEIPSSLMPEFVGPHYMTSRVNWAVQSSGVDYLHLVLVSMSYLTRRLNISTRFMLSIHDEVRFLVKDEHAMLAALCLQISNLWVRAIFAESVGIRDLPSSVAFFSRWIWIV
ncbi:DNA polymerase family A-domain-containing protein [Fimicolochytrium jonesii]|uniref:DNA polymerase family A-domain-containing protein n=1 Tax=Fimicolochytrium jonesii TaxID=1396493 RepID=UPI0022FEE4BD|nr:DNA polymerase family A-domain-containing protein [Fimicolochytrium jonesii]KAI8820406.1 DNA polymerase family A-domain-containing protein [Fimicolochytrium jonesii]